MVLRGLILRGSAAETDLDTAKLRDRVPQSGKERRFQEQPVAAAESALDSLADVLCRICVFRLLQHALGVQHVEKGVAVDIGQVDRAARRGNVGRFRQDIAQVVGVREILHDRAGVDQVEGVFLPPVEIIGRALLHRDVTQAGPGLLDQRPRVLDRRGGQVGSVIARAGGRDGEEDFTRPAPDFKHAIRRQRADSVEVLPHPLFALRHVDRLLVDVDETCRRVDEGVGLGGQSLSMVVVGRGVFANGFGIERLLVIVLIAQQVGLHMPVQRIAVGHEVGGEQRTGVGFVQPNRRVLHDLRCTEDAFHFAWLHAVSVD